MYFGLSEDQLMLQDSVGRYLEGASELEEVRKFVDGEGALAETLHKGLEELGVPFVLFPEAQDGLGMGVLEAALISETLGRHVSPSAFTAASTCSGSNTVPHSVSMVVTSARQRVAISHSRWPKRPNTGTSTLSPGSSTEVSTASMPARAVPSTSNVQRLVVR